MVLVIREVVPWVDRSRADTAKALFTSHEMDSEHGPLRLGRGQTSGAP
jgi:hypothetical protein